MSFARDFYLQIGSDALEVAGVCLHDWRELRRVDCLIEAQKWVRAARTNLDFAAAEQAALRRKGRT